VLDVLAGRLELRNGDVASTYHRPSNAQGRRYLDLDTSLGLAEVGNSNAGL
jgi:hypothetical protein